MKNNGINDISKQIEYKGNIYKLIFNFNVMEEIQEEYGTLEKWGELTDSVEPNAKAVKFGLRAMFNEAIDIENEENGTNKEPLTLKQVGRMVTEIGLDLMTQKLNETVIESSKGEEKNV